MRGKHRLVAGLALAVVLALAVPAAAQVGATQTFTTSQSQFTPGVKNQGWWSPIGSNLDANDNYFVGRSFPLPGVQQLHRNFFTFDLSSACQASRVTLQLTRFWPVRAVDLLAVRGRDSRGDVER